MAASTSSYLSESINPWNGPGARFFGGGPGSSPYSKAQVEQYGYARDLARNFMSYGANVQANKIAAKAEEKYQKELMESQQKGGLLSSVLGTGLSFGLKALTGGIA